MRESTKSTREHEVRWVGCGNKNTIKYMENFLKIKRHTKAGCKCSSEAQAQVE